jgi:hypothetical protein
MHTPDKGRPHLNMLKARIFADNPRKCRNGKKLESSEEGVRERIILKWELTL